MFSFEQLRGFVAVAEEGNFGRAAARLRMTQPPLSRQVQKLERAVGVELLKRTSRAVELTPAGRVFLDEARRMLSLSSAATLLAQRAALGSQGTLRLGFTAMAALSVLGRWVQYLDQHLPEVDLVFRELVTGDQVAALLAGEIDLGLLRGVPPSSGLSTALVHSETLVLAVPGSHPLAAGHADARHADARHADARHADARLADVAETNVVTYSPSDARYFHDLVVATFRAAGVQPRYAQHVTQVNSVLALVNAGLGVALVPASAALVAPAGLRLLTVPEIAPGCVEVHAAWRPGDDNPALAALLDHAGVTSVLNPA